MRTKINLLVAAAIFTLLVLGGNVYAKGNNSKSTSQGKAVEASLAVEAWMVNGKIWNLPELKAVKMESEPRIELEKWMTEGFNFSNADFGDSSLEVEEWMINSEKWNSNSVSESGSERENSLEVESWMVNNELWSINR